MDCVLQIPGKLLFSLVKRYLCVTSLLDQLNNSPEQGAGDRGSPTSREDLGREKSRGQRELEFSMAVGNLISELVRSMGWARNLSQQGTLPPWPTRSIFQPSISGPSLLLPTIVATPRRQGRAFRQRAEFSSLSGYGEYVQQTLQPLLFQCLIKGLLCCLLQISLSTEWTRKRSVPVGDRSWAQVTKRSPPQS